MNIMQMFLEKGYLLEEELFDILKNINPFIQKDVAEILTNIVLEEGKGKKFLSKEDLMKNLPKLIFFLENIKNSRPEKAEYMNAAVSYLSSLTSKKDLISEFQKFDLKKEVNLNESESQTKNILVAEPLNVVKSYFIPSRKIGVEDFVKHFRNRFMAIRSILEERGCSELISIDKIGIEKQKISIIGMVSNKQVTKNKNIILEVEDLSGKISVLISKEKGALYHEASNIILDEVIGLKCSGNKEILFANEIVYPDLMARKPKSNYDEYALFISDLHIGSTHFLEENFLCFIKWLNGNVGTEGQKAIAKKVKYLFVVGDIVDGVGIHPLQEPLLAIKDIKEQYEKAAELFREIRKDINIIICPGNHDALRIAEPQPQLNIEYAKSLYEIPNIFFVSNPATVSIRGINVMLYHGFSFDYYVSNVDSLRFGDAHANPRLISSFLLKKRHLAPTHTSTQFIPCENEDPLVVSSVPDVFVSAHLHKSDISSYNNLLTICCSCWQAMTPLEEKIGHKPDPGKVPMLHLKTGEVKMLDFG